MRWGGSRRDARPMTQLSKGEVDFCLMWASGFGTVAGGLDDLLLPPMAGT